ncbi:pol polyprotein [Fusarium austroafricanum]|uniref:RNA-directed DNA polymerase n=1 Tax=Fusarium austroafricanum TaxID=2364996 RepID=A0A8H4KSN9_9HYPO|nr:pol polyprotein [Fusarium austroafricanum]
MSAQDASGVREAWDTEELWQHSTPEDSEKKTRNWTKNGRTKEHHQQQLHDEEFQNDGTNKEESSDEEYIEDCYKGVDCSNDNCKLLHRTNAGNVINCGAKKNFIDPQIVTKLQLPWKPKQQPYPLVNAEGQPFDYNNGIIDKEIDHLKVLIQGKNQGVDFDILPLGPTDILLGMPWLKRVNLHIDWPTGQVTIPSNTDRDDRTITTNNERSQAQTEEDSKGMRESKDPPIPKGTRHQYTKGKKRRNRQILGMAEARWPKNETTQDRLHNVPLEYRRYEKLFSEELKTKKIYNLNEKELTTLRDYLETELAKGNIRISTSSAGFPVMFVPKKNGKLRLIVDYRRLNALTIKDRTPLPLITELKDRLRGKQIFTALDLKGAYNLIRIKEGDEWKTAFRTKFGLYEYLVMPFGLTNAPATFQRMINNVLRQYLDVFVVCYLDDILIFSNNEEEHKEHIHKVLQALQDANLLVEPEKSYFHVQEVDFLGCTITPGEIKMQRKKISAVADWPTPKTVKEVQSFLGFANYYRRFIKDFSKIANPLTELTKKDKNFEWEPIAQDAFTQLQQAILSEPILIMFDPNREVELETDSSDFALGGQIRQRDNQGKLHPIAFYSHKLHGAELNYPIYDKEFLAIVNCFKEFRHYLMGSMHQIKVYTDHQNISHFATTQELNRRQLRYAEYLCEFDFIIIHRKGSDNRRADAISRQPDYNTGTPKTKEQLLEKNKKGEYQFTQPA